MGALGESELSKLDASSSIEHRNDDTGVAANVVRSKLAATWDFGCWVTRIFGASSQLGAIYSRDGLTLAEPLLRKQQFRNGHAYESNLLLTAAEQNLNAAGIRETNSDYSATIRIQLNKAMHVE